MSLAALARLLGDDPAISAAPSRLAVSDSARALAIAAVAEVSGRRPVLVACPTGTMAARLGDDLGAFIDDVVVFPAWETLPFERISPSIETMGRRAEIIWRLRHGTVGAENVADRPPAVILAGARALLQKLSPAVADPFEIVAGARLDIDALTAWLGRAGYRREPVVEHRGEWARRGAIVDVFPSTADGPIRIDLWGDEVDRLTGFSVDDQRSTIDLERSRIHPARELLLTDAVRQRAAHLVGAEPWGREHWERLEQGVMAEGMESWLPWLVDEPSLITDLLDRSAAVVLVEPRRFRDRATDLLAEEDDLARTLASTWARDPERSFPRLHVDPDRLLARPPGASATSGPGLWSIDATPESPDAPHVLATSWGTPFGDETVARMKRLLAEDYRVVVAADNDASAERIRHLLLDHDVDLVRRDSSPEALERPGAHLVVAPLHQGCVIADIRLALITESDLTGRRRAHRTARATRRRSTTTVDDLRPGNYVVHHHHGVGRYEGLVTRAIGGVERDYLLVAYKGGDKLYVPSDQIDVLRQYVGGETPTLHRLGGSEFAATKGRVRSAIREIAQELVVLYQKRVNAAGHRFGSDTPWQAEMEQAFPYVETPDQLRAIDEVKADMELAHPMDRLICGDVGFGKTEIAIRAAFKAIQDGKQVAVLAPTTLLASQHATTFADRFAGYPIRVEMLSRFLTAKQARDVVAGLADGDVDCVIGTHRLLGAEIRFKDLGLLIVDEEQRFGVHHKEAMKHLRSDVDVLTLSATPIPRTLEMSLVGIRDLSLLQTPPADRQPILTYVGEFDERIAVEAIRRELLREGQVFWVHNRVQTIEETAERLRELVPEARIAVAHGQMDEGSLEQVVIDFWEGAYDVLVCTTIIESGIDMPMVNTLVVERADLLGLGQLHQIRGRVGRSGSRAYAYLFHPRETTLSEEAYERLRTIGESTELGSGFKIAMRDLEIRGAGNLLGAAQSGHIAAVGYDLYCQMVTEAVAEMKGETVATPTEIKIDVPTDAHLPTDYVPSEALRLEAYRRLTAVTTAAEAEDLRLEWLDRFGPLPPAAEALIAIGRLRAECHRLGITGVSVTGDAIRLTPLALTASQSIRLQRLSARATIREPRSPDEPAMVVVPIPVITGGPRRDRRLDPVEFLLGFLAELIPPPADASAGETVVAPAASAAGPASERRAAGDRGR